MRVPALLGFVAAIALGLAAGTGAKLLLQRPGAEGEFGAPPDSVAKAAADSARNSPDTASAAKAHKSAPPVSAPRLPVVLPRPTVAVAPTVAMRPAPDSAELSRARAREAARERIAKMFSAMEPKGAAAVLEQLSDEEVATILGSVSERQAGTILEYFTPQRAAAVSRALLNSSRSTP